MSWTSLFISVYWANRRRVERETLRDAFWARSCSYSLLIRLTSALREEFSSLRTSARCASSSHSAWLTKGEVESGLIMIEKGKNWRIICTCFRNLDRRADSLLDCFLLCRLSSLSSWIQSQRKDRQWQCINLSRKRRNTMLKETSSVKKEEKQKINMTKMVAEKSDDLLGAQHWANGKDDTSLEAHLLRNLIKKWSCDAGILGRGRVIF